MKRYRIYKVLKWIFAVWALLVILSTYVMGFIGDNDDLATVEGYVSLGIVYAVLAIFFKLQEDSNKPTVEE